MIESSFEEAFSKAWVKTQITDSTNELVILRQVIPWQLIIKQLTPFYDNNSGRLGKPLRVMVALLILSRLRTLSDDKVVEQVKENRYMQHFCNVPDVVPPTNGGKEWGDSQLCESQCSMPIQTAFG